MKRSGAVWLVGLVVGCGGSRGAEPPGAAAAGAGPGAVQPVAATGGGGASETEAGRDREDGAAIARREIAEGAPGGDPRAALEPLASLPVARRLYTYPTPESPEPSWADGTVSLLGFDPASDRVVLQTTHRMLGARGGRVQETIDVMEIPGGPRHFRIRTRYRVHVSGDDDDHLGRYTGSWERDVRQLVDFIEAEPLAGHWRERELLLAPDGRHVVVNARGRSGGEHGLWVATPRGRLLHALEPQNVFAGTDVDPVFTPASDRVVYGCSRYHGPRGRHPVDGLCTLDLTSGSVSVRALGNLDSAEFAGGERLTVLTRSHHPTRGSSPGYAFEICLRTIDLRDQGAQGPPEPIRCWDDAWSGSRVVGHPDDETVVLHLRARPRGGDPERIVRVRLGDGEVLEEAPAPEYADVAHLLPGLRVVVETSNDVVGFADLRTGRTRVWTPAHGEHLGSFTWQDVDGTLRLHAMHRPARAADGSLVELDLDALF